jgi:hypothetical protein
MIHFELISPNHLWMIVEVRGIEPRAIKIIHITANQPDQLEPDPSRPPEPDTIRLVPIISIEMILVSIISIDTKILLSI